MHLERGQKYNKTKCSSVFFSSFITAIGCWSALLLFWSIVSCWLNSWPSHWWCSVNGFRGCCWLARMIIVEWANELSKMLNSHCKLLNIFFFWIIFSKNQIIEFWWMIWFWLSCIHSAVTNCLYFVLTAFIVISVQFCHVVLIYLLLSGVVLLQQ